MNPGRSICALLFLIAAVAVAARPALAIDFYEIQIYSAETVPKGHLEVELHSNTVSTATGHEAKDALNPYQIHETLEASYGVLRYLEVGQYLCTARLNNGEYEYAGARTKVHFGVPMTERWPVRFGANIELDYMRRQADENPLTLELRPIVETHLGRFTAIGNFAFEKPFSGPGTHRGVELSPSGEIVYDLSRWIQPAVEYYGDLGPLQVIPGVQRQEHFIVPALNLDLIPQLELNLGVGIGLTRTSNGLFLKSIVGWAF
ncbi:MAG: hypothetical protein Q7S58_03120 [Candidatus Binatus sp.]|uniref:hypothetical protein n=1 Tax=Candidatus Binatus sp. TaxID=2811406 RepID=UPI002717BA65|nr:hypothetical protein [Candidatus Binatus sp.]MDO8431380.1 hypothetical protein [Candidatus Binatus sp.]